MSSCFAVYGVPTTKTLTLRRGQLRNQDNGLDLLTGAQPMTISKLIAVITVEHRDAFFETTPSNCLSPGLQPGNAHQGSDAAAEAQRRPMGATSAMRVVELTELLILDGPDKESLS